MNPWQLVNRCGNRFVSKIWQVTCGIVAGASEALENGGLLIIYGPFKVQSSEFFGFFVSLKTFAILSLRSLEQMLGIDMSYHLLPTDILK